MANLNQIMEFIKYIRKHRKENKARIKETLHQYNFPIRMSIKCNGAVHDLHKVSPFSISRYSEIYNDAVRCIDFSKHAFKYEFSKQDEWIYTPVAIEAIRDTKLFKLISKFNNDEIIETEEDLEELADNIKTVCGIFGENPASFYLRNYYSFGLEEHYERKYIETLLEIDFDDYFDYDPEATVEQVFDKCRYNFDDEFCYFVFVACLNRYGVNMYEVLGLDDIYFGINDQIM